MATELGLDLVNQLVYKDRTRNSLCCVCFTWMLTVPNDNHLLRMILDWTSIASCCARYFCTTIYSGGEIPPHSAFHVLSYNAFWKGLQ